MNRQNDQTKNNKIYFRTKGSVTVLNDTVLSSADLSLPASVVAVITQAPGTVDTDERWRKASRFILYQRSSSTVQKADFKFHHHDSRSLY
jgi:hypothetical protein